MQKGKCEIMFFCTSISIGGVDCKHSKKDSTPNQKNCKYLLFTGEDDELCTNKNAQNDAFLERDL